MEVEDLEFDSFKTTCAYESLGKSLRTPSGVPHFEDHCPEVVLFRLYVVTH